MVALGLAEASLQFASEVQDTLDGALPGERALISEQHGKAERFVVRPDGDRAARRISLTIRDRHVADLDVAFYLTLDHRAQFLKAVRSDLKVYLAEDGIPLVRLEYRSDMNKAPVAHWHVHAAPERFSGLLDTGSTEQRDLSFMHLPVGGERFRPCLEDFLEYLIRELSIDARPCWEDAVRQGRERWRLRQLRAAVRDTPAEAAAVLTTLGWSTTPPAEPPQDNRTQSQRW